MNYEARAWALLAQWEDGGALPPLPFLQALLAALAEDGEPVERFRQELLACVTSRSYQPDR